MSLDAIIVSTNLILAYGVVMCFVTESTFSVMLGWLARTANHCNRHLKSQLMYQTHLGINLREIAVFGKKKGTK